MHGLKQKFLIFLTSLFLLLQPLFNISVIFKQSKVFAQEALKSEISFNKDSFNISVNTKQRVEYIIAYKTDSQIEAIKGTSESSENDFSRTIFAGTCSTGGTCMQHNIVRGVLKTKIPDLNWASSKKFIFENGIINSSTSETSDSIELSNFETDWLNNGGDFVPEGDILEGLATSNYWILNPDGSYSSNSSLSLNTEYIAPFNKNLIIKFSKLPEYPGNINVKEIAASFDLGEDQQVGSIYEITSNMVNGDFIYDLTLPVPQNIDNENLKVKYAESIEGLKNSETINEERTFKESSITIKNLNHFTLFIVTANPTTSSEGASGTVWTNENNVYSSNNARATATLTLGESTKNLKAKGFGLNIPSTATIEGIEVKIEKSVDISRTNAMKDNRVQLVISDLASGNNYAKTAYFNNTTDSVSTYGSQTDLWGLTLTPSQLNSSNFGVAYSAIRHPSGSSDQIVRIDHIQIKVYYDADVTAPVLSEITPVSTPTNSSTNGYIFNSSESGNIIYSGSCSSITSTAVAGDNAITFDTLLDGTYSDCTIVVTDAAGNDSNPLNVSTFLIDTTPPTIPEASPIAGEYTSDQTVSLSSVDLETDYVDIYYTTDGTIPDTRSSLYSSPILVDHDITIKAIAYNMFGDYSNILEASYLIAPTISNETSSSVSSTTATITWETDDLATSRVIYDTVSHATAISTGDIPYDKYGYTNTTDEFDTDPKVTSHSVGLSGLTAGTTYYYRVISHGSPEAVSDELSLSTTASSTTSTGTVAGASTGGVSTPTCSDTKPGSAPSGFNATAGLNSVTLSWNKASDPVSYYLITYGLSSGSQTFGNPNAGNSSTTSYTVSNLSGGITYYFKVRAGNGCAPGEFSSEVSVTPSGGFVEGPATGFEPGVLGEATEEAKLKEEIENNQTLGKFTQTLKQNKLINYLPYIALLLIIVFIILKRKRKNMVK